MVYLLVHIGTHKVTAILKMQCTIMHHLHWCNTSIESSRWVLFTEQFPKQLRFVFMRKSAGKSLLQAIGVNGDAVMSVQSTDLIM